MSAAASGDLVQTLHNITEKVDWAERSLARLREAACQKDAIAVQDHFWSFLHASQLLWFYIGRYFRSSGNPGSSARTFVQEWLTNNLDANEQSLWHNINNLRTSDVHVEPVVTEEEIKSSFCVKDGKFCVRDGKFLIRTQTRYVVMIKGTSYECQSVADGWIVLARRMIEYLQHHAPC